jgi:thiosulfate dehydrogenase
MRFLESYWCPLCLGVITTCLLLVSILGSGTSKSIVKSSQYFYDERTGWRAPSEDDIPADSHGDAIRYGKELIVNTSRYLGPKGIIANMSNGMNCQNCHLHAGRDNYANPFSAVSSIYPVYRERSGRVESIEFRVNDCMIRSLNGKPLDSLSLEMRGMVAYLQWISQGVPKGVKPKGAGTEKLPFLSRAANPGKGKQVFVTTCQRCHGTDGQGSLDADGHSYKYPPLWGDHSYNSAAGMYLVSKLAGFIKNNMPFEEASKDNPVLSDEQAWDVAAFISSQPRPVKSFSSDWPKISSKPVDYPFGPYTDNFSEQQHKYGPFVVMKKK